MKFSKLISILLTLMLVSGVLFAMPASASTSTVSFFVTPANACVTLNGVTKSADDGLVIFEVADGTYDCQVAATGYVWQAGSLTVSGNAGYLAVLTADTEKSYWTFDTDLENWTCNNATDTISHENGALKLAMASGDPGVSKNGVSLDMTGRDKLYLTYKKEKATESSILIYFKSVVNGTTYNHSGARALTKTLPAETEGFVTEVFEKNEYFAGTVENLRIDPITSATGLSGAAFYIDKIEIPKIEALALSPTSEQISFVIFNVTPEDAEITLNGVTKKAVAGKAYFVEESGTYECRVAKTGYVWQEGALTVVKGSEYSVNLTEDSANSYWTFDTDLESWACNNTSDTLSHENGALKLAMASNDPGISKNGISLDMTGREKLYLTYKKEKATESDLLIYFKSVVNGTTYNHSSARALTKTLPTETEGFVTEVFEKNEYFAGTIENLRIDPITSATGLSGAAFYIDKIEIPKVEQLLVVGDTKQLIEFSVSPANAEITLFDNTGNQVEKQNAVGGKASFVVDKGDYTYVISKYGFATVKGSLTAGSESVNVEVSLVPDEDSYYFYDFSRKASVTEVITDGWNISSPETLEIDEAYGIQTGAPGVENTFSYMLDQPVDTGTIEVSLDFMGETPVAGGYFDASLRSAPNTMNLRFYVTGAEGNVFQYATTDSSVTPLRGNFDFSGELHKLSFVINLDAGTLMVKHDGEIILDYLPYNGNTFAGIYMHYKPDCKFYWKSVGISHSTEAVPSEQPRWIHTQTQPGDYSLVVLGDTQILPLGSPNTLGLMAQWILENKEKENIQYVIHVGDVTGNNQEKAWENFTERFSILDGEVPMAVVPGNHDYEGLDPWGGADVGKEQEFRSLDRFNRFIPYDKVSAYPTFGGAYEEGRTENIYHCFRAGNINYLILGLEFAPRDSVVEWANEVVASHPDHNVIVTTHGYMTGSGILYDENNTHPLERYLFIRSDEDDCNNGQQLWDKLLKKHKNIFLVLNGHSAPVDVRRRVDLGENGNQVLQFCVDSTQLDRGDYSFSKNAGMMLQMRFSEKGTKIDCNYYSAFYGKYYRPDNQFTVNVPADQIIYDDGVKVDYYIDGEKAEAASLENNEYILKEGEVSVVAENPGKQTLITATYKNEKLTGMQSSNEEKISFTLPTTADSIIKTFVWHDMENISPAKNAHLLSKKGYAKIEVLGTEEVTVKLKNMTTGKTYYDLSSVPHGLYEYTVDKDNYISQAGYISVSGDCIIEAELTHDDAKHKFSFSDSDDGFNVLSEGATSYPVENGIGLQLSNGAYIENNSLDLDVTNRDRLVLTYKNMSPYTDLQVQYKIKGTNSWVLYPAVINGYCKDFTTTTLDLSGAGSFSGTIDGLRLGLISETGAVANIELCSLAVTAEEEVNFIDGNNIVFSCNTEGAKITLKNLETGRTYEKITTEAGGTVDFGEMLLGTYEYIVYKQGYSAQNGTINLTTDTPVLEVTLKEDTDSTGEYRWDFETSVEEFTGCNANSTAVRHQDGCLVITATGNDPYAYTVGLTAKALDNRKMVVIRYKNESSYNVFTLYFVTTESGGYNSVTANIKPSMLGFDDVCIDMTDMAGWNGNLTQLRIDPEGSTGMQPVDFYIDSIELVNVG